MFRKFTGLSPSCKDLLRSVEFKWSKSSLCYSDVSHLNSGIQSSLDAFLFHPHLPEKQAEQVLIPPGPHLDQTFYPVFEQGFPCYFFWFGHSPTLDRCMLEFAGTWGPFYVIPFKDVLWASTLGLMAILGALATCWRFTRLPDYVTKWKVQCSNSR